ncbi:MAG: FtsX-like permease family protein [Elusimicrobiota bacterium]
MFLKLAWRNMFRNKRRTAIAGFAIGMGLASLIFVDALVKGMEKNMIESATSSFLGEAQIHETDFRKTQEVEKTIKGLGWVLQDLDNESAVKYYAPRTFSFGMITSPANVSGVSFVGVDPVKERNLSVIARSIVEGEFLSGRDERDIVIGKKLADDLEAGLGDRVVVTVSQAGTGDLVQEMFRISGIFSTNGDEMEKGMIFAGIAKARQMLGIGPGVHEIAVKFADPEFAQDANFYFWNKYSRDGNEAVSWTRLLPDLRAAMDMSNWSIGIVGLILFIIVSLGIINALFMSLYERMFEFGVLRAVGTRPLGISKLIMLEAGALALISIVFGSALGFAVTWIVAKTGIDYTGIEYAKITFRELIYPILTPSQFVIYPFWVLVSTMLAGLYPAFYAARMKIVDSMRKSM